MDTSLGIFIPTIGRSTLKRAVESIYPQLGDTDELTVIGDGPQPSAQEYIDDIHDPRIIYLEHGPTNHWGGEQLDFGCSRSIRGFFAFCGDDDFMPEGALESIRRKISQHPPMPHIFAMMHSGKVLSRSIGAGSVCGQQIVVPNVPDRLAKWADDVGSTSDWVYITSTLKNWESVGVSFHDDVICILEQMSFGKVI